MAGLTFNTLIRPRGIFTDDDGYVGNTDRDVANTAYITNTISSQHISGQIMNMLDYDSTTYLGDTDTGGAASDTDVIVFDLGLKKTFATAHVNVTIKEGASGSVVFNLQTSSDGTTYTTRAAKSATTSLVNHDITIGKFSYRYLRLQMVRTSSEHHTMNVYMVRIIK